MLAIRELPFAHSFGAIVEVLVAGCPPTNLGITSYHHLSAPCFRERSVPVNSPRAMRSVLIWVLLITVAIPSIARFIDLQLIPCEHVPANTFSQPDFANMGGH